MRQNTMLPKQIRGKWIWLTNASQDDTDHVFFRRVITLSEMPGTAELWVASHCHFQAYVNGRRCLSGPAPHPGPGTGAYAQLVDVSHALEIGVNHIAVHVHYENTPLANLRQAFKGLWLQLELDGEAALWTDEEWRCHRAFCYTSTGLRAAAGDVFKECLDYRLYPNNWQVWEWQDLADDDDNKETTPPLGLAAAGAAKDREPSPRFVWKKPDFVREPDYTFGALEADVSVPRFPESLSAEKISEVGTFKQTAEATWVSFTPTIKVKQELGTYADEAFIYCPPGDTQLCLCICDNPYRLYVNGVLLKEQATPPPPVRMPLHDKRTARLSQQELVDQECRVVLQPGWNRILFVQNCLSRYCGMLMLWPDMPSGALQVYQRPAFNSPNGWSVVGPLNTPLSLIYPTFPFDQLSKTPFVPGDNPPDDISAFFLACTFTLPDGGGVSRLPVSLKNNEYLLVDFGRTYYGYPDIVMTGKPGDVVDIVFGEHCIDGEVIAYESNHRRNTSTVILDEDPSRRWVSSLPKGFRYYMVVARSVQNELNISHVGAFHEVMDAPSSSNFACSLPQLEAIWTVGQQTLAATMQRVFMDSPTKDQAQCIPDAMIQSWAGYYVFGTYQQTTTAIEAFARSQLETGEMNALSPSGQFQAMPDFSLNWPVWLHRHILHTGDVAFLKKMLPALQNLLYYYDQLAGGHDAPLGDLHEYLGTYCFLDHGAIDREGIVTGLNALYCRALLSASWLAAYAEESALSTQYKNRASHVAMQIRALCWDAQEGLYADSYHHGAKSPFYSWQTNVLAIYGGIAEPSQYQAIWDRFFIDDAPLEQFAAGEYNNPYFKYYLLEAAFALGKNTWALRLIHYYWGRMVKAGATSWWELFDPDNPALQKRMCSQCCGNGTSPNGFLITELVGIRPAEPGMYMVYFNPMPGDVTWVKAHIPTPNGYIYVDWNIRPDGVFAASISANYPLEVIPILNPAIAETAVITVSEKVAILAQE